MVELAIFVRARVDVGSDWSLQRKPLARNREQGIKEVRSERAGQESTLNPASAIGPSGHSRQCC
jgi:hypothetical protein